MSDSAKKAAVLLATGAEEMEAVTIIDILRRGGVEVRVITPGTSCEVICSRDVVLLADSLWDDQWLGTADMLVVPGGMGGTRALQAEPRAIAALQRAAATDRLVAAICAGPAVLATAGLLEGRRATCYPGLEGELTGASYQSDQPVVSDRGVITSQGPGTAIAFALELVRTLCGSDVAAAVVGDLLLEA